MFRRQPKKVTAVPSTINPSFASGPASNFETISPRPRGSVPPTAVLEAPQIAASSPVAEEARRGLTSAPKTLSPWLFYDEAGSRLFEQITALPEYYPTRTERDIFTAHAAEIFSLVASTNNQQPTTNNSPITIVELGAGTASKTGILLRALTRIQPRVLYQPIDISPTALDEARTQLESAIPGITVRPQTANYVTETVRIERPAKARILALYIGSSIGNFSPSEARQILTRLRSELQPGDALLLGADLAPCPPEVEIPTKSVSTLLAAYNDKAGVTAAFNRNILVRLNRELGADFQPNQFAHRALWNHTHSRIEMHLQSLVPQTVRIPANAAGPAMTLHFAASETIHTENSYKFTPASISALLADSSFAPTRTFTDSGNLFAVTLAEAL
jgi:L-histidine N-alpha-methyltransferase